MKLPGERQISHYGLATGSTLSMVTTGITVQDDSSPPDSAAGDIALTGFAEAECVSDKNPFRRPVVYPIDRQTVPMSQLTDPFGRQAGIGDDL